MQFLKTQDFELINLRFVLEIYIEDNIDFKRIIALREDGHKTIILESRLKKAIDDLFSLLTHRLTNGAQDD